MLNDLLQCNTNVWMSQNPKAQLSLSLGSPSLLPGLLIIATLGLFLGKVACKILVVVGCDA